MAEQRQSGRRTSARLREKEDMPPMNGTVHTQDKDKPTARQSKLGKNGSATEGRARSKRKLEYDEEDDGFRYTRAKSKRTKAARTPEPVLEETRQTPNALASENAASKTIRSTELPQVPDGVVIPKRRNTRNSGEKLEPLELHLPKRRSRRTSAENVQKSRGQTYNKEKGDTSGQTQPISNRSHTPDQRQVSSDTTKIALPFADTPIIRRNKEMRKGSSESRRSSLSNRGRRASSLIDSGTSNALPHHEVEAADFYKHIESGLLEPRRMRQLLIWCGTRALGQKPSCATEDGPSRLVAREIQQQLLKDFSSRSELSDWLSREEPVSQAQALKPNPKNIANLAKIEELEQKLRQLQEERQSWETLLRPASKPPLPPLSLPLRPLSAISTEQQTSAVLEAVQSQTYPTANELCGSVRQRLTGATQAVEDEVDKLVESVNTLGQYLATAEDVEKSCLDAAARALEERDKKAIGNEGAVGVRDVLRGLSRVVER